MKWLYSSKPSSMNNLLTTMPSIACMIDSTFHSLSPSHRNTFSSSFSSYQLRISSAQSLQRAITQPHLAIITGDYPKRHPSFPLLVFFPPPLVSLEMFSTQINSPREPRMPSGSILAVTSKIGYAYFINHTTILDYLFKMIAKLNHL